MTPQDLIAAIDELAEAPDGVTRLRELVLQLAVRGKLVPQDPEDEPASVLLQRIAAEKARLVAEKKIRKPKALPALSDDEVPFDVPEGWEWARCESLFAMVTDGDHQPPPRADSGVPFLVIGNVSGGTLDFSDTRFVPRHYFRELHWTRQPRVGDLLYTVTGSYGITLVVETDRDFCVQRHIGILKATKESNSHFLKLLLTSPQARAYAAAKATGTAQKTVSLTSLRSMPLPVPPLAEQKRIVARVDELMGLLDRLEAARAAREATRTALRDAALAALRDAESTEDVAIAWQRIAEEMHDLFKEPADLEPLRQTVLHLAVRGKLVNCPLREMGLRDLLAEPLANGRSVPDGSGYPVLRLTALRGRTVDTSFQKSGAWTADEGRRFRIEEGDMLVVRGSGSRHLVARASVVERTEKIAYPDTVIRVRPQRSKVVPEYLFLAWESPRTREVLEEKARTTAGIWKVSQADLYDVSLPVPGIAEQKRIVARVDELMGLIDRLEQHLNGKITAHDAFAAAAVHHLEA